MKHDRRSYCWFCLPGEYVNRSKPIPSHWVFHPASPAEACPFTTEDGSMTRLYSVSPDHTEETP